MAESSSSRNWQRLKEIVADALERPPETRTAFLDAVCGGDEELHAEVVSLLDAAEGSETLQSPVDTGQVASLLKAVLPESPDRERVGSWHLVKELGRGGMGVVYLADRVDGDFEQRVALKLVKRGMDSDAILTRFRNERQVLASLQHPHIARLYDGGVTEEGQPWFAMEYIDGLPITDYCNEHALSLDERLELFEKVCRAVEHAHNRLIIHRDLKPSNILVDNEGEPKLLDFGLAKVLQDPSGAPATTCHEQRWMTLDYASPEQVRGEAVGTPSDTYQLGLVLYEILTGKRAYTVKGLSPTEAERAICEVDPLKPSTTVGSGGSETATQGRAVRKRLRGDLDTIVMKALHKDPNRGYSSAETLASDLERHLESLPVHARPDTLGYRAGKFVQRHRWPVLAAVLVFLTLLGGMAGTLWQADRATANERRALDERARAEEVTEFLVGLFEPQGTSAVRRDTVSIGEFLEQCVERAERLNHRPDFQATIYGATALVYRNLGNNEQAGAFYRRALATWETVERGPQHDRPYAEALHGFARTLVSQSRLEEAEPLLREAFEVQSRGQLDDAFQRDLLFSLYEVHHGLNQSEAANDVFDSWLVANERAPEPSNVESAGRMLTIAQFLGRRGEIRGDVTDIRRGRELIDQALAIFRERQSSDAQSISNALLVRLEILGYQHDLEPFSKEALARVDTFSQNVVSFLRATYPNSHPKVASGLFKRSTILMTREQFDNAEEAIQEAMAIAREANSDGLVMRGRINLARLDFLRGNYQSAASQYREIRDYWAESYAEDYLFTLHYDLHVGTSLIRLRQFEQAEEQLLEAYETLESQRGRTDRFTQQAIEKVVDLYDAWGKPEEARRYRERLEAAEAEAESGSV